MIKNIVTMPRVGVMNMIYSQKLYPSISKPWALISIFSEYDILSDFKNCEGLVSLQCLLFQSFEFADITDKMEIPAKGQKSYILFNEDHARGIINFIDKVKDTAETLVIHCAAGISRSGALGLFAARYLGLSEQEYYEQNRPLPNFYILGVLNKVAGVHDDYAAFWEDKLKGDARKEKVERARSIALSKLF